MVNRGDARTARPLPRSGTMNASSARDRMLAGLPAATVRMVDVNGVATSVVEAGDGPPLVLLHGAIECGGAVWAPVIPALAAQHRVVVPDLPGLGESAPVDRLGGAAFGAWFVALLERLTLSRPALVAHSLGGSLALRLALYRRDLCSRLIISAAPAIGPYRMPARLRYLAVRFAIRPTAGNAERFQRFALHDLNAARARDPGWFEAFESYLLERAGVAHVSRTMRRLIATETKQILDADLGRLDVNLLWGRHDRMVPLVIGQQASARYGWPLHVIDDAAHVPQLEQPDAVLRVLAQTTAGGPPGAASDAVP